MTGDDWTPRPDDHLVEPFFGGLSVEPGARTPPESVWRLLGRMLFAESVVLALLALLWVALRLLRAVLT